LLFDVVLKGNPRVIVTEGILFDPEGKIKLSYAWMLEISINNQAKAYIMLQGMRLALYRHITSNILVGDSNVLFDSM